MRLLFSSRGASFEAMGYNPRDLGADCDSCPLKRCKPIRSPSRNQRELLAIVGEAPGYQEEEEGRYFVGASGAKLRAGMLFHSIDPGLVHINNALQCRPKNPLQPKEWKQALMACRPRLLKELESLSTVLAVGRKAFAVLTGFDEPLKNWAGTLCESPPRRVIATYHPSAALRGKPELLPIFYTHLGHAWDVAIQDDRKVLNWPRLVHCKTDAGDIRPQMLRSLVSIFKGSKEVGYDTETAGTSPYAPLTAIGIASSKVAVSVPWPPHRFGPGALADDLVAIIKAILASPKISKVAHNAAYDTLASEFHGFDLQGRVEDTILEDFVYRPLAPHSLQFATSLEYIVYPWKRLFKVRDDAKGSTAFTIRSQENPKGNSARALTKYNAEDAYAGLALHWRLKVHLEEHTHRGVELYEGYLRRSKIASQMRKDGAKIIRANLDSFRAQFAEKRTTPLAQLQSIGAKFGIEDLNPRSNAQLRVLFFDHLGAKKVAWSERTGDPSLGKQALLKYALDTNEAVRLVTSILQEFRRWDKLLSFVSDLKTDGTDFVYPEPKIWGTKGGRWSYSAKHGGFNPQTVPKPRGDLPGLQGLIGPRPGNWICCIDYSQLECRIVAALSGAPLLLKWYAQGLDVHAMNAERMFGHGYEKHLRNLAKRFLYGLLYGGGIKTIWQSLAPEFPGLQLSTVEKMSEAFYITHGHVLIWQRNLEKTAREKGYVEVPLSGLRQYFPGGLIEPTKVRNFPIQGTASCLLDRALEEIASKIDRDKGEYILFQRHDELVLEGPDPLRLRTIALEAMERPVVLQGASHVFPADFSASPISWADANTPNREYKNDIKRLCHDFKGPEK